MFFGKCCLSILSRISFLSSVRVMNDNLHDPCSSLDVHLGHFVTSHIGSDFLNALLL